MSNEQKRRDADRLRYLGRVLSVDEAFDRGADPNSLCWFPPPVVPKGLIALFHNGATELSGGTWDKLVAFVKHLVRSVIRQLLYGRLRELAVEGWCPPPRPNSKEKK